ncbi:hypothetical protein Pan44_54520 [Caulifigura coniformis]|uniref:Uncharacterized protein n=1 Tax=Caulifigura coniformis TaxID=2527983 RepID=A0A517SMN2_9PLAN|nr:hypothetical protein [Caulifigura coniformis]QDT57383.1 hypothetical protein Pan44_54520 [Caulifigura coniformis]
MAPATRLNALQKRYVEAIASFSGEDRATVMRLFFKPGGGVPESRQTERKAINGVWKALRAAKLEKQSPAAVDRIKFLHEALVFAFERRHGEPFKKPRTKAE